MEPPIGPYRLARRPQPLPTEEISRATHTWYNHACGLGRALPAVSSGQSDACAMTGLLALACFTTGFIVAWLLRTILVMAQISWSQAQMQQKVRYWQGHPCPDYGRTAEPSACRNYRPGT